MKDNEKFNIDDILEMIEIEGLQGALLDYILPEDIEDPKLAELWETARDAIEEIIEIIGEI